MHFSFAFCLLEAVTVTFAEWVLRGLCILGICLWLLNLPVDVVVWAFLTFTFYICMQYHILLLLNIVLWNQIVTSFSSASWNAVFLSNWTSSCKNTMSLGNICPVRQHFLLLHTPKKRKRKCDIKENGEERLPSITLLKLSRRDGESEWRGQGNGEAEASSPQCCGLIIWRVRAVNSWLETGMWWIHKHGGDLAAFLWESHMGIGVFGAPGGKVKGLVYPAVARGCRCSFPLLQTSGRTEYLISNGWHYISKTH